MDISSCFTPQDEWATSPTNATVSVSTFLHNKCLNDYVVEFLYSTITPKAIFLNGRLLITIVIFLHKQYGFVVFSIFCFCFCRSRPCLLQLFLCSVNIKQKAYPFCLPKSFNDILYLFNMPFSCNARNSIIWSRFKTPRAPILPILFHFCVTCV